MATQDSVSLRAVKAAEILSVQVSDLLELLKDQGIGDNSAGLELLDSPTTTVEDLVEILITGKFPSVLPVKKIPAKAAANALKNSTSTEKKVHSLAELGVSSDISVLAQALKPIQQWDDKSLLENFISTRSAESEEELDRRAKHQKFVVLKDPSTVNLKKFEPGREEIDVEATLNLLRSSRKRATPSVIPIQGGFAVVYRVTELNPQDRMIELCPICGEALYQGYCEKCQVNFAGIGDDARAYVRLIVESGKFEGKSSVERKAVVASAANGVDDLKVTWPSLVQKFDELKLTNSLPRLRLIANRPSTTIADPFHAGGNRKFVGNVNY